MRFNLPFGHVGGLPESIDELPGFHDKPKYELDSWEKAERDRKELNSDRRGADHGDSLPSMPPTRRRKRRNWESPASFEHQEAYILDPKPFQDATARRRTQTRVICSFRINESNKPIRKALMTFISSCTEMVEWVQRLGLPANSIRTKLPYHRDAMRNIKVQVTSPSLQRLIEASRTGDLYNEEIPERPKPVFRTAPPGIGTVVASNLLLVWVLMTVRI